jgi:hypothetical protein
VNVHLRLIIIPFPYTLRVIGAIAGGVKAETARVLDFFVVKKVFGCRNGFPRYCSFSNQGRGVDVVFTWGSAAKRGTAEDILEAIREEQNVEESDDKYKSD